VCQKKEGRKASMVFLMGVRKQKQFFLVLGFFFYRGGWVGGGCWGGGGGIFVIREWMVGGGSRTPVTQSRRVSGRHSQGVREGGGRMK